MKAVCHGISLALTYGRKIVASKYRSILVTGGAGFIGSNYLHYILEHYEGLRITVLDKLTYAGNLENLSDVINSIRFIKGDIANPNDVAEAMNDVDAVINFAAESHVDRSIEDPLPFLRTNVEGVFVLLNEARKRNVERFLQVSTDEVYGDLSGRQGHSVETDPFAPRSPYAASKASAEHIVCSFFHSYGLDVVITRGANTYGQYQFPEKIIPLFITNAIDNKPLPVYADGTAIRDYMHVQDHVAGIDKVLQDGAAGEAYNLGTRQQISGIEVARRILRIMDRPIDLISYVADRPGHDYRYSIDPTKAEILGWKPEIPFDEGLQRTIDWYRKNELWWRKVKDRLHPYEKK